MKYYLPTTTLNFSNILSSEAITPACRYSQSNLGFNHFELCAPNCSEMVLFLYDNMPEWTIAHSSDDDYPLILELDATAISSDDILLVAETPERIWATFSTIYIEPINTRFLFGSSDELDRLLIKMNGTLENKCENLYRDSFVKYRRNDGFRFTDDIQAYLVEWEKEHCAKTPSNYLKSELNSERKSGAELGFSIGCWLRSALQQQTNPIQYERHKLKTELNTSNVAENDFRSLLNLYGRTIEDFLRWLPNSSIPTYTPHSRNPTLSFEMPEVDESYIPAHSCLVDVLKFIVSRNNTPWSWAESELVSFCSSLWTEVLWPKLNEKKHSQTIRTAYNQFLRNLQSQTEAYSIKKEQSHFLQAFTTFIIGGIDAGKLARMITSQNVRCPEITLALYGAIVGYSRFPRTLMELGTYELPTNKVPRFPRYPKIPEPQSEDIFEKRIKQLLTPNMMKQLREYWHKEVAKEGRVALTRKWVSTKKRNMKGKEEVLGLCNSYMADSKPNREAQGQKREYQPEIPFPKNNTSLPMFCEDEECVVAMRGNHKLDICSKHTKKALAESLRRFQQEYKDGHYSEHTEKYARDNPATINHFLCCLVSNDTQEYNVDLTQKEKTILQEWMERRYSCKRKGNH